MAEFSLKFQFFGIFVPRTTGETTALLPAAGHDTTIITADGSTPLHATVWLRAQKDCVSVTLPDSEIEDHGFLVAMDEALQEQFVGVPEDLLRGPLPSRLNARIALRGGTLVGGPIEAREVRAFKDSVWGFKHGDRKVTDTARYVVPMEEGVTYELTNGAGTSIPLLDGVEVAIVNDDSPSADCDQSPNSEVFPLDEFVALSRLLDVEDVEAPTTGGLDLRRAPLPDGNICRPCILARIAQPVD